MNSDITTLLLIVVLAVIYFLVSVYFEKKYNIFYESTPIKAILVLIPFIVITTYLYLNKYELPITILLIETVVLLLVAFSLNKYWRGKIHKKYAKESAMPVLNFSHSYLLPKYLDVVYQQLAISYSLLTILEFWDNTFVIIIFPIIFGILHLPMLWGYANKHYIKAIILPSFIFSFIFVLSAIHIEDFIIYTLPIHYLYYFIVIPVIVKNSLKY
jgi:hypothetical protein